MSNSAPHVVEILPPKRNGTPGALREFGERYERALAAGCAVGVPDNPMGKPRLGAIEAVRSLGLPVRPDRFLMNLNTYHTGEALKAILDASAREGVRDILVVRGDGSPLLSRLEPAAIGSSAKMVDSIELIGYVHRAYPGVFVTGCAFNQYKTLSVEGARLARKIAAGAKFVVTQPALGDDPRVRALFGGTLEPIGPARRGGLPVLVGAWMSRNTELLARSVKGEGANVPEGYDPVENLKTLRSAYAGAPLYLSMLDFAAEWESLLPRPGPARGSE